MDMATYMRRKRKSDAGFTMIELMTVIAIITFLIGALVVAFGGVQSYVLSAKTETVIESIDSAMASYYLHFHAYPPDTDGAGLDGSESLCYHLRTAFRLEETITATAAIDIEKAAIMVKASKDAGPFLEIEGKLLKDEDADGFDEIYDPMGGELHYDEAPKPADYGGEMVNAHSYNIWSEGVDMIDQTGRGDDIGNWVAE